METVFIKINTIEIEKIGQHREKWFVLQGVTSNRLKNIFPRQFINFFG